MMQGSKEKADNDSNIRKMAHYLMSGAKMLDLACPICNNPIFQLKNGEKACVVCERKVVFEDELITEPEIHDSEMDGQVQHDVPSDLSNDENVDATPGIQMPSNNNVLIEDDYKIFSTLKQSCLSKINILRKNLDNVTSASEIEVISRAIKELINILEKIKLI
ncbi:MAG: Sjogren's syndrome/scleroderma autoantigen 1 family protein [Promethearchaeota archaeon]